jgi:hypothetical protein
MWLETPEQRLNYIKQRQSDLAAEAIVDRSSDLRGSDDVRRFTGLRIQFGRVLIMVGQMSSDWTLPSSTAPATRPPRKTSLS